MAVLNRCLKFLSNSFYLEKRVKFHPLKFFIQMELVLALIFVRETFFNDFNVATKKNPEIIVK